MKIKILIGITIFLLVLIFVGMPISAQKLDQYDPPWSTRCENCARPRPTKTPVTRSPTPSSFPIWVDSTFDPLESVTPRCLACATETDTPVYTQSPTGTAPVAEKVYRYAR